MKAASEEKVREQQLSIEFDDKSGSEEGLTKEIINPDRTGVKIERPVKKEPIIKTMDRSAEVAGVKKDEE